MATLGEVQKEKERIVDVVTVVQHGDKLVIPEGMSLERVDRVVHQKMEFDNTDVAVQAIIPGFVPEAAYAWYLAMADKYGWVNQVPTPGFFGPEPPATITVDVDRGKSIQVPWGRFELPYIDGYLESSVTEDPARKGVAAFAVTGKIKRKHEDKVNELVSMARANVRERSIYRGKAFRLRVKDERGKPLPFPTPQFLDLNPNVLSELVFPTDVRLDIDINLFTPIMNTAACRKHRIPLKRGVLLAGDFGVGKTMAAHATALLCVQHGWTYIVVERADELGDVLRLAVEYGPAVAFCEDIDRVMTGDRNIGTDAILNIIDGVESKNTELMIVLTTNDIDNIEPALLRPGRLDAVIYIEKPDAEAAERLARQYGRGLVSDTENITEAAQLMAGRIPAVIRETVERSKLASIFFADDPMSEGVLVTNEALLHSAKRMQFQLDKLEPKLVDNRTATERAAERIATAYERVGASIGQPFTPPQFPIVDGGDALDDVIAGMNAALKKKEK